MFKNKTKGKFIVIEGLDGSGASTQTANLEKFFKKREENWWFTQEPTAGPIGKIIKKYLTKSQEEISSVSLQLLFAADRDDHLNKEILPKLKKGINVFSDRYFLSSLAYGSSEVNDQDWLYKINDLFLLPDLTILLKTSVKVCLERIKKNRTGLEIFESRKKLEDVWKIYELLSKKYPNIKIINGDKSEPEVFQSIKEKIAKII